MKPFIHIIKLRRIQSKIHRRVYRVDKDIFSVSSEERAGLETKMEQIRAELDEWVRKVPHHPTKGAGAISWMYDPESAYHDSRDFFILQYHKSILSLYTVFLPVLQTSDLRFLTTARSAACVCRAYKRLNQQKTLSYTMMALHSCFIAGLTLVYCLWREHALFSYDTLEATRACSQSLTIGLEVQFDRGIQSTAQGLIRGPIYNYRSQPNLRLEPPFYTYYAKVYIV
ncbi:fungal specific transcription factor domain-containing protein [Colletotrichum cuscutae]|uniref:Fungal specific transcription factor domain-containing protein n=1 Tax=Colletotrichum cuscutae TaxID=1209917 RepID=A0AAI9VAF9_9PEZI|nr:fungal specific transcription factor domain-containing protein [Colletotrichum cuscutae]